MPKRRRKPKISAHNVTRVPDGAKLVHEDDNTKLYLSVKGELFLVRLEYVTYRLRGPRA